MRLTVGPLPAAVYWRRRAFVLGVLVLVIFSFFYSCTTGSSTADTGRRPTSATGTPTTVAAQPRTTLLVPTSEEPSSADPSPTSSAFALPTTGVTGPCSDTELVVSASAAGTQVSRGTPLDLTIRFRNVGYRTCRRDIGADLQELRIMEGKAMIWSSDDCNPNHGHDLETFTPGRQVAFTLRWNGRYSRSGTGSVVCGSTVAFPPAGAYDLFGRLDSQLSQAYAFQLT
jgi:hypothetical protein